VEVFVFFLDATDDFPFPDEVVVTLSVFILVRFAVDPTAIGCCGVGDVKFSFSENSFRFAATEVDAILFLVLVAVVFVLLTPLVNIVTANIAGDTDATDDFLLADEVIVTLSVFMLFRFAVDWDIKSFISENNFSFAAADVHAILLLVLEAVVFVLLTPLVTIVTANSAGDNDASSQYCS